MSAAVLERITEDEARTRREDLLRLLGGDGETIRARARNYLLDADEQALYDELEDLDYLLSM